MDTKTKNFYNNFVITNKKLTELELFPLENIVKYNKNIVWSTKYGKVKICATRLKQGVTPNILSSIETKQYFLNLLKEKNFQLYNTIEILDEEVKITKKVTIKNDFGILKVKPYSLLAGSIPNIISAIDKTEYFYNYIKFKYPKIFERKLKPISEYIDLKKEMCFIDKYGVTKLRPQSILKGYLPCVKSALNKTSYWINMAKEVHGDKYDYSLVDYKNTKSKVKIICPIHGVIKQSPFTHLKGSGCMKCGCVKSTKHNSNNPNGWNYTSWQKAAERSKNFDSYKVYIIKCWSDQEEFYKVGRTYLEVSKRFNSKEDLPYSYKIIEEIIFKEARKCCEYEKTLKSLLKNKKYTTKIKFAGYTECFSINPLQAKLKTNV